MESRFFMGGEENFCKKRGITREALERIGSVTFQEASPLVRRDHAKVLVDESDEIFGSHVPIPELYQNYNGESQFREAINAYLNEEDLCLLYPSQTLRGGLATIEGVVWRIKNLKA